MAQKTKAAVTNLYFYLLAVLNPHLDMFYFIFTPFSLFNEIHLLVKNDKISMWFVMAYLFGTTDKMLVV